MEYFTEINMAQELEVSVGKLGSQRAKPGKRRHCRVWAKRGGELGTK